ncbi:little elongation complex subunit 2-like [Brachionichthys hirsutus]|uniref:little elongation complex subunit 2-like n=1 Tax=Brachionichthys hirsutus TaxID=412623 RepID=UPI0036048067
MDLVWEDRPVPDAPAFTRELYDKFSLAPSIRELWAFLQSPVENARINQKGDVGVAKPSSSATTEKSVKFKDDNCKDVPHWGSCATEDLCADNPGQSTEECQDDNKAAVNLKQSENDADAPFPPPRLPYPRLSWLSTKEHLTYLNILMSKKAVLPPQRLMERINKEVMEFTSYLQDVAKRCADDYNFISQGAMQYSEDFLRDCLECLQTIPQLYQIHEMTSLTGGTFNPGLTLTFEKQLLIMGSVDITDHQIVPADAQLASDYQSVSSVNPPAKKAKDVHATISSDSNAEKLCSHYEPHVCLTRDALVRLLGNHGPDFGEKWEVPVWVKLNPGKGSGGKKTVFIDSPLQKTEVTVRERSRVYHEESLKRSIKRNGRNDVFHVMTELPASDQQLPEESSQRNIVSFEDDNNGIDFEVDLVDLETFGDSTASKRPKMQETQKEQDPCAKSKTATSSPPLQENKNSGERIDGPQEVNTSSTEMGGAITQKAILPDECQTTDAKAAREGPESSQEDDLDISGDTDDEKLVIDVSPASSHVIPPDAESTACTSDSPVTAISESGPFQSEATSPQKARRPSRQSKRSKKVSGDQLSEILRMQTAMFNSASDAAKCSNTTQEGSSPAVHPHPVSLVKPCVSSYLERNQNQDGETTPPRARDLMVNVTAAEHKKILSQDLQAGAEDEQDYEAPEEGNLLYKLYSLQDVLLMIRSSISLTHSRRVGGSQNQYLPVHVLPKMEYQLCYGVECLSSGEACKLWTETRLHSSTVSYIAHINAFTSKVALLRKLPDNWEQNTSCGFKPSKSLNILHHLLKKLTGLEEGRYLITHKAGDPFVTLMKAANGKVTRAGVNLQQIHSCAPQPPSSILVPWIPVDPAVLLPFHKKHKQIPCSFPVKPLSKPPNGKSSSIAQGAGGKSKKKKNKNRAARRNEYMKNLIRKSVQNPV